MSRLDRFFIFVLPWIISASWVVKGEQISSLLPPGVEIVSPKELGLSDEDVDKFLGKVTSMNTRGGNGPKTQILTVGFGAHEKLNLENFQKLPEGLSPADKMVTELAIKGLEKRQNQNQNQFGARLPKGSENAPANILVVPTRQPLLFKPKPELQERKVKTGQTLDEINTELHRTIMETMHVHERELKELESKSVRQLVPIQQSSKEIRFQERYPEVDKSPKERLKGQHSEQAKLQEERERFKGQHSEEAKLQEEKERFKGQHFELDKSPKEKERFKGQHSELDNSQEQTERRKGQHSELDKSQEVKERRKAQHSEPAEDKEHFKGQHSEPAKSLLQAPEPKVKSAQKLEPEAQNLNNVSPTLLPAAAPKSQYPQVPVKTSPQPIPEKIVLQLATEEKPKPTESTNKQRQSIPEKIELTLPIEAKPSIELVLDPTEQPLEEKQQQQILGDVQQQGPVVFTNTEGSKGSIVAVQAQQIYPTPQSHQQVQFVPGPIFVQQHQPQPYQPYPTMMVPPPQQFVYQQVVHPQQYTVQQEHYVAHGPGEQLQPHSQIPPQFQGQQSHPPEFQGHHVQPGQPLHYPGQQPSTVDFQSQPQYAIMQSHPGQHQPPVQSYLSHPQQPIEFHGGQAQQYPGIQPASVDFQGHPQQYPNPTVQPQPVEFRSQPIHYPGAQPQPVKFMGQLQQYSGVQPPPLEFQPRPQQYPGFQQQSSVEFHGEPQQYPGGQLQPQPVEFQAQQQYPGRVEQPRQILPPQSSQGQSLSYPSLQLQPTEQFHGSKPQSNSEVEYVQVHHHHQVKGPEHHYFQNTHPSPQPQHFQQTAPSPSPETYVRQPHAYSSPPKAQEEVIYGQRQAAPAYTTRETYSLPPRTVAYPTAGKSVPHGFGIEPTEVGYKGHSYPPPGHLEEKPLNFVEAMKYIHHGSGSLNSVESTDPYQKPPRITFSEEPRSIPPTPSFFETNYYRHQQQQERDLASLRNHFSIEPEVKSVSPGYNFHKHQPYSFRFPESDSGLTFFGSSPSSDYAPTTSTSVFTDHRQDVVPSVPMLKISSPENAVRSVLPQPDLTPTLHTMFDQMRSESSAPVPAVSTLAAKGTHYNKNLDPLFTRGNLKSAEQAIRNGAST